MKQVPASSKVDIDPETGAMKRMSGETRTNPYDLFALETALQIREKVGGTVTVLTMGPPQAEEMMRDAYTMGADDAVILSDRKFAGADVLATSYALAQGIQVIGGADLIICGRQTTDGDTAQVGPAIAEHLTIPHAAWVAEIVDVNEKAIQVRQDLVIFLCGPYQEKKHEPDAHKIFRLCDTHIIPLATNLATAELLIKSLERGELDWREMYKK